MGHSVATCYQANWHKPTTRRHRRPEPPGAPRPPPHPPRRAVRCPSSTDSVLTRTGHPQHFSRTTRPCQTTAPTLPATRPPHSQLPPTRASYPLHTDLHHQLVPSQKRGAAPGPSDLTAETLRLVFVIRSYQQTHPGHTTDRQSRATRHCQPSTRPRTPSCPPKA